MTASFFADARRANRQRLLMLVVWLVAVVLLARQHVFWRDEVRALSLALQGDNVFAMLAALRGEGHPALWYLLLRGADVVFDTPLVLPGVALAVALAAMAVLTWRAPFASTGLALVMFSRFGVYEYAVMARNYGLTMLLLFVFAALYRRFRDRSLVLGMLLSLLANCSVHSLLLVAPLGLYWSIDLLRDGVTRERVRHLAANAALALVGVAICLLTLFPAVNDAAARPESLASTLPRLALALLNPGAPFEQLLPMAVLTSRLPLPAGVWHAGLSLLLFAVVAGLVHRRAAFWAALVSLLAYVALFTLLYDGYYRHDALWLVFVVVLYWLAGRPGDDPRDRAKRWLARSGSVALAALLLLQVGNAALQATWLIDGAKPESRSRDFALWLESRPDLAGATIAADPDYLVEPLPYYLPAHRTYLMREQRYGAVVRFTHSARARLDLDDILQTAARLRSDNDGRPVLILLNRPLDELPATAAEDDDRWLLLSTPEQVQRFRDAAPLAERFGPVCCSDESFDVYVFGGAE